MADHVLENSGAVFLSSSRLEFLMSERKEKENLRLRLGAIVLALLTIGAVVFSVINFQQRRLFEVPDDGVSWLDNARGVQALYVTRNSSAERAGIKPGDTLLAINDVPIHRAVEVTKRLWAVGVWSQARYRMSRRGQAFQDAAHRGAGTEAAGDRKLSSRRRAAVPVYRPVYFRAALERQRGQCTFIFSAWCRSSFARFTTPAS